MCVRMSEHIHISMLFTISFFLLITTLPQSSHCQPPPQGYNYSICMNKQYDCGKLSNILYPFSGHNRPAQCGGGEQFKLNCEDDRNITTIEIESQNFQVREIDTTSYTMRLVLTHDVCSPQFYDNYLSLSHTPFQYTANVYNLTIFYGCSSGFECGNQNVMWLPRENVSLLEEIQQSHGCQRYIQVPVLEFTYGDGGLSVLQGIIRNGFEVKYTVDKGCPRCSKSGGVCGIKDSDELQFSCYCPNGSNALDCYKRKRKVIIGVGSATMAGLLICIIICCIICKSSIWKEKYWLMTKRDPDIETFLKDHGAMLQKRYKFSEVKKMTNSFKDKLGQGGFGAVYKGKLLNGHLVAIKILKASKGNGEEFLNEVASISRTSHVNIVNLLGFCFEGRKKALIYEFMSNGSLDKFIYNKGHKAIASLNWENLYQISIGIARGLEYLHRGCNTRILHFDIKPHNILLDENLCPKISDFGLAKLCPKRESIISMSDARGTMGYVAPEVWNRHFGGVSHKSDVYSYGMMILEMVGGRKNINVEASHTSEIYFPHWVYNKLELGNDLRPSQVIAAEENEITRRMAIVGLWCIQTFPSDRPTMSRVIDMLEGSMNSLEMPPKPFLSSPSRSVPKSSTS